MVAMNELATYVIIYTIINIILVSGSFKLLAADWCEGKGQAARYFTGAARIKVFPTWELPLYSEEDKLKVSEWLRHDGSLVTAPGARWLAHLPSLNLRAQSHPGPRQL